MEPLEAVSEGEWSSLSGMYTTEEANFMAQLLGNPPINIDLDSNPGTDSGLGGTVWGGTDESSFYSSSANCFSQTSNYTNGGMIFSNGSGHHHEDDHDHYLNLTNPHPISNGSFSIQSAIIEGDNFRDHEVAENINVQLKLEEQPADEKIGNSTESLKRRSRSTGNVQKLKRNVKLKKSQSLDFLSQTEEEGNGSRARGQNSSTCCSEDDSTGSQEQIGGLSSSAKDPAALNLSGKTRASRGSATDPQSLYARKRRERINERLKILQNLVPNGTKVDISTMLEEAVHYVKFLQLQIKLLSSDDLWMYAPIAYNGIDIGLDLNIYTPRPR